ncbi:Cell division control protein 14 like [Zalerion maritima]|uniref:Cell division control protein 14 like n=1 Tax=Zalerion maritima TaxID=339359 RepID=A0AAD5RGF2_9PEZI|nr:Cell division control protein 14 like [Zalerion maritima]
MESLLALAFDNLSSYDGGKIKKGVKQVEGVLASMCLAPSTSSSKPNPNRSPRKHKRNVSSLANSSDLDGASSSSTTDQQQGSQNKSLNQLADDPAFREFFKTQEGFQYNIATHLLDTLERLVARGQDGQYDLLIVSVMDILQGVLLLHPPSKKLFAREQTMNLVLDLIEPVNCPAIQSSSLSVLIISLIDVPENNRCFEALDGLLAVSSLLDTLPSRSVGQKLIEVIYVWLMPETPSIPRAGGRDSVPGLLQRSPSKLPGVFARNNGDKKRENAGAEGDSTLSVEEKAEMLKGYMEDVDEFVVDLKRNPPFEGVVV